MSFLSPLRYPGGKRRLANFIKLIFYQNELLDGEYAEPYAGGASVALSLLYDEYVRQVHINDLNPGLHAFWNNILNNTEALCQLINDTPVTIEEWRRQRQIQNDPNTSPLELGFSTFFLNRTNRSGIITGGVIGGKEQIGSWKLDARYNKVDLIQRIKKVARYKNRIHLYNLDAIDFIKSAQSFLSEKSLIYLDPPYFVKGQQLLYTNYYQPKDHSTVAKLIYSISQRWIVSYDDANEIRKLYENYKHLSYNLHYSAQERYQGAEVMFFCDKLDIPDVIDPSNIKGTRQ